MKINRTRYVLAYALGALILIGMAAGCMTDLTRGRDFGDPPVCEIHARVMTKQRVPVISGYDLYGPGWCRRCESTFPIPTARVDGMVTSRSMAKRRSTMSVPGATRPETSGSFRTAPVSPGPKA